MKGISYREITTLLSLKILINQIIKRSKKNMDKDGKYNSCF